MWRANAGTHLVTLVPSACACVLCVLLCGSKRPDTVGERGAPAHPGQHRWCVSWEEPGKRGPNRRCTAVISASAL